MQVTIPALDPDYNPPYHTNSNGWLWWTRPDGKTECWLNVSFSSSTSSWANDYYISANSLISNTKRTYPVVFSSEPVVTFGFQNKPVSGTNYNFWVAQNDSQIGTTTQCPGLYAVRVNSSNIAGNFWIHAIGDV